MFSQVKALKKPVAAIGTATANASVKFSKLDAFKTLKAPLVYVGKEE